MVLVPGFARAKLMSGLKMTGVEERHMTLLQPPAMLTIMRLKFDVFQGCWRRASWPHVALALT